MQTGLIRAAVEERFRRVLSFHGRVGEAEAMAAAVPATAARLAEDGPDTFPPAGQVWADWLYGEHAPAHRRAVLEEFAADYLTGPGPNGDGTDVRAELRVLSSVRVLGEGVDTAECDAVLFADARGSMVDIVQMVGRALRMRPGVGKLATLIVPVFLGQDEDANELLTSDAYGTLAKILGALQAHDTDTIEALADPRVRNARPVQDDDGDSDPDDQDQNDVAEDVERVGAAAAGVLRFSEERDPAALAQFVRLRVIDPEAAYWRRGIEVATRWLRETGSTELRVPYTYVSPEDWGAAGTHPLGVWIADQRRYYAAGTLEASRVEQLEALGMVWSVQASAWEAGLAIARSYAEVHGHLLPPTTAVWGGDNFPIGVWLKNQRAAARKTAENAERRAAAEPGVSYAGELSDARVEALTDLDPGWCPAWELSWQRNYRLTLAHRKAGGPLPAGPGELIVQGEDLGAWAAGQRAGWDKLVPAQQWLLESVGIEPPAEGEPVAGAARSRDARWEANLAAARRFHAREGHLQVPRQHVEITGNGDGEQAAVKLGAFLDNTRRRAAKLTPQRRAELDQLGMRW
ncbi:Helicase associated domain protein [Streptomyces sp. NPDC101237]|uniref:Helicase associated domain protein n=1 Tax=Streptomyces sp. NPDC101237 TaxID=3366139 RepID=UPI0038166291